MLGDGILEFINRRQRQILVHSFLYYQLDVSIISDFAFDKWSQELADTMGLYPDVAKESAYYEAFKDFDGSTGHDLPFSNPDIQSTGLKLLAYHKQRQGL